MAVTKGDKAPAFTLTDTERAQRSLSEFLGRNVVLAFYPGAFTGVCQKELCSFRDSLSNLSALNAQVVAISVDSPFANKAFASQNNLPFPVLSDVNRTVAQQYAGVHTDFAGIPGYTAAKRSVFILDSGGVVRYAWVTENPGVEPDYSEIAKQLKAIGN